MLKWLQLLYGRMTKYLPIPEGYAYLSLNKKWNTPLNYNWEENKWPHRLPKAALLKQFRYFHLQTKTKTIKKITLQNSPHCNKACFNSPWEFQSIHGQRFSWTVAYNKCKPFIVRGKGSKTYHHQTGGSFTMPLKSPHCRKNISKFE